MQCSSFCKLSAWFKVIRQELIRWPGGSWLWECEEVSEVKGSSRTLTIILQFPCYFAKHFTFQSLMGLALTLFAQLSINFVDIIPSPFPLAVQLPACKLHRMASCDNSNNWQLNWTIINVEHVKLSNM